jgi:RIO kinase 1
MALGISFLNDKTNKRQNTLTYPSQFDDDNDLNWASHKQRDRSDTGYRKRKDHHKSKKTQKDILQDIVEVRDLEGGFQISYQPTLFEEGWLQEAVRPFYDLIFITDVLSRVKGGKEASVYRGKAHESLDVDIVAIKVYRPRMFRNLRQDHLYREGRQIMDQDGKVIKSNDARVQRAVHQKSKFGQQVRHTSWLTHEYKTLQMLYNMGLDVPKPYAVVENAILMTYYGDETRSAPTLNEISLPRDEAKIKLEQLLHNIEVMLKHGVVHGDLSAYNILMWENQPIIIDFPQIVDPNINRNARFIFERDVVRVCEYFNRQGIRIDGKRTANKIWRTYYSDEVAIDYDLTDENED